ncbi:MAG: hypothetical protein ACLFTK_15640 [Anaerolineales bacterium]
MGARWQTYLDYIRARARRAALRAARLAEDDAQLPPRGPVDGGGGVRPAYQISADEPPWSADDLRRFEALQDGGEWPSEDDLAA